MPRTFTTVNGKHRILHGHKGGHDNNRKLEKEFDHGEPWHKPKTGSGWISSSPEDADVFNPARSNGRGPALSAVCTGDKVTIRYAQEAVNPDGKRVA